jgi:hypothetical protein
LATPFSRNRQDIHVSVSTAVMEEISYDLSVQDALARGYANITALAKVLRPRLEEKLGRKVGEVGVMSALKRLRGSYTAGSEKIRTIIAESVVNVRTHVSKVSVERTRKTLEIVSGLLASHQQDFLQVSESMSFITLIFDQKLHKKVRSSFSEGVILEEGDEYAAIIVQSPPQITTTPGCLINFYNQIARRHVNIEDTVSCHTDTILVVKMSEVGKGFTALTDLISQERKLLELVK